MMLGLSACEQPNQPANITNDTMSFQLPVEATSVDNPQDLVVFAYVKEQGSTAAEVSIQLLPVDVSGLITAREPTNAIEANKTYDLRLEIFYKYSDVNGSYLLNILNTPSKTFTTVSIGGDLYEGRVDFSAADFVDRKLFPDDDLDGYTNLDEIDSKRGNLKTDPRDSFDFPDNNKIIKSPHRMAVIVCPRLNNNTIGLIANKYNYPTLDERSCSKNNSFDFTILHSSGSNSNLSMLMASDLTFTSIPMMHIPSQFSSASAPFLSRMSHGILDEGASFYNLFDSNCSGAHVCDNINGAQPALVLSQPASPIFFVNTPARSPDQTAYLPTWMRLDDDVDEKTHTNRIVVSWERIYNDQAGDMKMELKRAYKLTDVTLNQWSPDSPNPTGVQIAGKGLDSPVTVAVGTINNISQAQFQLKTDSLGFDRLEFVDDNIKGGVVYYYTLTVTTSNNITATSAPVGIATHAAIPFIDEFPANNFRGDVVVNDIPNGQGGYNEEFSLEQPVAYGTQLDLYYIPNDDAILTAANKETFKVGCDPNGSYPNCVHVSITSEPYAVVVQGDPAKTTPTRVLIEKSDRYGRYAGFQIRQVVH